MALGSPDVVKGWNQESSEETVVNIHLPQLTIIMESRVLLAYSIV